MILLLEISCNQQNIKFVEFEIENSNLFHTSSEINKNNLKIIKLKSENISGLFTEIAVKDSLLICGTLRSQKLVNIYSLNSKKLLHELIGRGELPNQGLSVANIFLQNNFAWLYDITSNKFFKMDLLTRDKDSISTREIVLTERLKNIVSPNIIADSLILATTYSNENFRYLYANPKRIIKDFGSLPNVINPEYLKDTPNTLFPNRAFVFKAIIEKQHSQNNIAIFYNKTDRIEFYSNNHLRKVLLSKDHFNPIMQVSKIEEGGFYIEDCDHTRYSFLSTAQDDKFIYALYSGTNETSSNKILIYSWNGFLQKKLYLNRKVCKICIDSENNILYCYDDQSTGIYSTTLNF